MNEVMTILCDVASAVPATSQGGRPLVKFTLEGVGQPGIALHDVVACVPKAHWKIKELLVAADHLVGGDYLPEDLADAVHGKRIRAVVSVDTWQDHSRFTVKRWLPPPPDPDDPARTRYYRGACAHGHEFYGAITGPTTPVQLFVPCPLDGVLGCGQTELRAAE